MLLFSEVGMPLTQHYRVYKGGLPHAVFRTDYLPRLRSLLPSPGGADISPADKCGVTPTSESCRDDRGDDDRLPSVTTPGVNSVKRLEPGDDFRCAGLCFLYTLRRDRPVDYEYGHE